LRSVFEGEETYCERWLYVEILEMRPNDVRCSIYGTEESRKEIMGRANLTIMGVSARYIAAYPRISKMFWWDKDRDCGPIVEQATHFGKIPSSVFQI